MDLKTVPATPSPAPPHRGGESDVAVGGLVPSRVMQPQSVDEAAADLGRCYEEGLAVIPQGGRTQMGLGAPPRQYDVAFSSLGLSRLLEHEPADLTCRAEAGMRLGDLQAALGRYGQRLPLDPPHPERATVGGMLAANSNGLARARYGTVRDWVIGISVIYPSGNPARIARAGGKVVKNVAGYDLMKLHIGALGTLGVIAEANFKVQTLPEARASILAHFQSPGDALRCAHRLAVTYLLPARLVVLDREVVRECGLTVDWPWTLALELEGYRPEVEAAGGEVAAAVRETGGRQEASQVPAGFWEAARDWPAPDEPVAVVRAMTSLTGVQQAVNAVGLEASLLAQPAAGIVHVRPRPGTAPAVLQRLRTALAPEGSVIVERAPTGERPTLDAWGALPQGFGLMQGLKASLDPRGILNPGRFVGGI